MVMFPFDQFQKSRFSNYDIVKHSISVLKNIGAIESKEQEDELYNKMINWFFSKEVTNLAIERIKFCKKALSFEKDSINRSYLQSRLSIAKKHFKMLESERAALIEWTKLFDQLNSVENKESV